MLNNWIVFNAVRCEVGDLSAKHGQLNIRAAGTPERTLVFYDPNLPLVGPYTSNYMYSTVNGILHVIADCSSRPVSCSSYSRRSNYGLFQY